MVLRLSFSMLPLMALLFWAAGLGTIGWDVFVLSGQPTALSWWGWAGVSMGALLLLWSAVAERR